MSQVIMGLFSSLLSTLVIINDPGMKFTLLLLLSLQVSPQVSRPSSKAFFVKLYRTDSITYTLTKTKGYIKSSYDETCPETITFNKGSDQIVRSDCHTDKTSNLKYTIAMEGNKVTFSVKSDIWNEYNSSYDASIDNVAVAGYYRKDQTVRHLREKLLLTLTHTDGGKTYQRFYENDDNNNK
jgi:hypothetical protein